MDSQRRCGTGGGKGGVRWGMGRDGGGKGLTESESWYPHAPYPTEKNVLYTRAKSEIKYQRSGEVVKWMDGWLTVLRYVVPRASISVSALGRMGSAEVVMIYVQA